MSIAWLVAALAGAEDVEINGVIVDSRSVAGMTFPGVTVRFDAAGRAHLTIPGFIAEGRTAAPPVAAGVPRARWWLATEDGGSTGHKITVEVNGKVAVEVASGQPQRILDLAPWLVAGANTVIVRSVSTAATGGALYVYVATGTDRSGTVLMDAPTVQFGLGATRSGAYERTYTLDVTP